MDQKNKSHNEILSGLKEGILYNKITKIILKTASIKYYMAIKMNEFTRR